MEVKIGLHFICENLVWEVQTDGTGGYWGCVCLRTRAFVSFSTKEIEELLKIYTLIKH